MKTLLLIALFFCSLCFFTPKANAQTTKGKPVDPVASSKKIIPKKEGAKVPMTKIEIPRMVMVGVTVPEVIIKHKMFGCRAVPYFTNDPIMESPIRCIYPK